jgi:DNA-binding beta-propeller fold protein YncE
MDRGNNRVAHVSAEGQVLSAFGRLGIGPGDIYAGWDIELDAAGNIYICNLAAAEEGPFRAHDGVKVFTQQGRFLRELGGQDYRYEDDVEAQTPYGLDIDDQGRVYVAGFDSNIVRVFEPDGTQLAAFFGERGSDEGQFKGMVDVAIDDRRSLLYVTDQFNSRVQQFELSQVTTGVLTVTFRLSFGSYGRQAGQFAYPQDVVVDDQNGLVYISDMGNRRIQIFDPEGQFVKELSAPVDWQVIGLDLDSEGRVYATDALNNLIWVFEPDGQARSLEVRP